MLQSQSVALNQSEKLSNLIRLGFAPQWLEIHLRWDGRVNVDVMATFRSIERKAEAFDEIDEISKRFTL
ncbi:MAG TPA: hypothetical protein VFV93_11000 [Thermomicrobiales bacterium]|nr:hypothetical protein [Thermomicrobiales bacterium]